MKWGMHEIEICKENKLAYNEEEGLWKDVLKNKINYCIYR